MSGREPRARYTSLPTYRAAFDEMVRDPEFLAEAEKLKVEIDATGGERIEEISKTFYALPPETVERARELIE